jgi:hypothetical protein
MSSLANAAQFSPYQSFPPHVRSTNATLHFFWRGVHDPTSSALYFRFLYGSSASEWSPLPLYKTAAVMEKGACQQCNVTAQLRLENVRGVTSGLAADVML